MSRTKGAENKDKEFREALRMELRAAGSDHKALRAIARNLIAIASGTGRDALGAINVIADRLDGKPAQSVDVKSETTQVMVIRAPDVAENTEVWLDRVQQRRQHKTIQ